MGAEERDTCCLWGLAGLRRRWPRARLHQPQPEPFCRLLPGPGGAEPDSSTSTECAVCRAPLTPRTPHTLSQAKDAGAAPTCQPWPLPGQPRSQHPINNNASSSLLIPTAKEGNCDWPTSLGPGMGKKGAAKRRQKESIQRPPEPSPTTSLQAGVGGSGGENAWGWRRFHLGSRSDLGRVPALSGSSEASLVSFLVKRGFCPLAHQALLGVQPGGVSALTKGQASVQSAQQLFRNHQDR